MSASIGPVGQLVAVIRSQLAGRSATPARTGTPAARPGGARYEGAQLQAVIETRVRAIGRDDPQRGRKAFRVFLEAVLLSQFGEHLVADPKFFQMVDDIHAALEADPITEPMVTEAIAELLKQRS